MQKNIATEWHRADILCALKKEGWSLAALSREAGLHPGTLKAALTVDYPKGERIIAAAIGVKPEEIWPERYAKRRERQNFHPVFPKTAVNG